MKIPIDSELQGKISRILDELEESLEGRGGLANFPLMSRVNNEIADLIERWTSSSLRELGAKGNAETIAHRLAEVHGAISGASEIKIRADARSVVLEVKGCPRMEICRLKTRARWCMPDMIVAAIVQRAMETPVRMTVDLQGEKCLHEYRPAWLVDLLTDLDIFGAEGLVVLYGDRLLFSHLPTEEHAEALSESVLIREESPGEEASSGDFFCHNRKIMLMRFGKVFVSVCLRPEGADETGIREQVAQALGKADLA